MKTSEFIKSMEDNGYKYSTLDNWLNIRNQDDYLIGYVDEKNINIFITYDVCPKVIAQAILDYAYTPLEEREEEKKYYLMFPNGYNRWYKYLGKELKQNGEYDCVGQCIDKEAYKNRFTQKEIDEMPFDTKFFTKVELE